MENLKTNGFMEMSENEMYNVEGGDASTRIDGAFETIYGAVWFLATIAATGVCEGLSAAGIIPEDDYIGVSTETVKNGWHKLTTGN